MRKRSVDVERLARDPPPFWLGQRLESAHVVQAVGELYQDDANVVRHRQQHLADVLGLVLLLAAEADAAQLGHPFDQTRDISAELLLHLLQCQFGVFNRVVQQRRHDGRRVELEVGKNVRDFERMVDVLLA